MNTLLRDCHIPSSLPGRIRKVGMVLTEIAAAEAEQGREFWFDYHAHIHLFRVSQYSRKWDNDIESEDLSINSQISIQEDRPSEVILCDLEILFHQLNTLHNEAN